MEEVCPDASGSDEEEVQRLWDDFWAARWALVEHYLPLAEAAVRSYMKGWEVRGGSREDATEALRDEMIDELVNAVGRFNPQKQMTFGNFFRASSPGRPGPAQAAFIRFVRRKERELGLKEIQVPPTSLDDPGPRVPELAAKGGSPEDIVLAIDLRQAEAAWIRNLTLFVRLKINTSIKNLEKRRRCHEVFDNWILQHSGLPHEDGRQLGGRWRVTSGESAACRLRKLVESFVEQFIAERGGPGR